MISSSLLSQLARAYVGAISLINKIHTTPISYHQSHKIAGKEVQDTHLWYTALPKKSLMSLTRQGRRKVKKKKQVFMPKGPLLISCKNNKFNHYKGMHYKEFTPVPLASKGWHSKKSNGDYFSILPKSKNPAFDLPHDPEGRDKLGDGDDVEVDFKSLGVNEELVKRLKTAHFEHPTYIQQIAIPKLLSGKHVLITGETGCGKTLAYAVPILDHIMRWKSKINMNYNTPLALIVVPTRELALQVGSVISNIVTNSDITCKVVLAEYTKKFLMNFNESDLEKVDIVVSTLGIMCKFTYHNVYRLNNCLHIVLDEADTLLDDSFSRKLQDLLKRCKIRRGPILGDEVPYGSQLSLISATIPKDVETSLSYILPPESLERLTTNNIHKIPPHITQHFIRCKKSSKPELILELVKREVEHKRAVIIFSNRTETCNWLAHFLRENGFECARLNKAMNTQERITQLENFREGSVHVLTCTDIASRGHDIRRVNHVVNYEFPNFMADYVHRCGRTGRIGNESRCEVTSFISSIREIRLLNDIEMSARTNKKLSRVDNNIKGLLRKKSKQKL